MERDEREQILAMLARAARLLLRRRADRRKENTFRRADGPSSSAWSTSLRLRTICSPRSPSERLRDPAINLAREAKCSRAARIAAAH